MIAAVLRTLRILALAASLAATGCGGGDGGGGGGGDAQRETSPREAAGPRFTNPVFARNFPDPFVLRVGKTYYAYGTNGERGNVQTLRSGDLVHWRAGRDALPKLGRWAYVGKTWAPEVLAVGGKAFVLYYTANAAEYGRQCIGRAVSRTPVGPFVDRWSEPLVCQHAEGGSIDASPFRDRDGTLYLLWKNDGNCCGMDTWIYAQRLSRDGTALAGGRPTRLVKQDKPWEASVVEAPTLWTQDGRYYLFFSANAFDNDLYAVGYATCKRPLGPCKDAPESPILESACKASGPGHQAIVRDDDGETWIAYHAWPQSGEEERELWIDPLEWEGGKPDVVGPTCRAQPVP